MSDTASSAGLAQRRAMVDDLPPLRDQLMAEGLWARKALGQHFLLDLNLTARIVREARLPTGCHVIEVGPGPGGLTRPLLAADIAGLTVIEMDERFAALHRQLAADTDGFMQVIEADALTIDPLSASLAPRAIVANLPYNVGTPLLVGWLKQVHAFDSLTLMFQKEVADRIVAPAGDKTYGRLSVLVQLCCESRRVMVLPARAFTPPPKIDSAVIRLTPAATSPEGALFAALEQVTAAAFGQRRKMLRASLKPIFAEPEAVLAHCGIKPTSRAETVEPPGFLRLAQELLAKRG